MDGEKARRTNKYEHNYPDFDELLHLAQPISRSQMIIKCGLESVEAMELALETSIHALKDTYKRSDLAEKLEQNMDSDLFYPSEDTFSEFLISDILKVLGSKGAKKAYFSSAIGDSGNFEIKKFAPMDVCNVSPYPVTVMDENKDFAFTSYWDSFFTIFIASNGEAENIVKKMNWEGIICDKGTYMNWYLSKR